MSKVKLQEIAVQWNWISCKPALLTCTPCASACSEYQSSYWAASKHCWQPAGTRLLLLWVECAYEQGKLARYWVLLFCKFALFTCTPGASLCPRYRSSYWATSRHCWQPIDTRLLLLWVECACEQGELAKNSTSIFWKFTVLKCTGLTVLYLIR